MFFSRRYPSLDDGDLTASLTSRSSTVTLNVNNEAASIQDEPERISAEAKQQLIEFLFADEENNRAFLDGNLASFLEALDAFFAQVKLNDSPAEKRGAGLTTICDQIWVFTTICLAPEMGNC